MWQYVSKGAGRYGTCKNVIVCLEEKEAVVLVLKEN